MSVTIVSSTDNQEAVAQAMGQKPVEQVEAKENSDAGQTPDETPEASEALESASDGEEPESPDEDEASEDDDQKVEDKPKKNRGITRRINKLNQKLSAKEQEIEYWKQEALKSKPHEKPQEVKPEVKVEGRPSPDNYQTHEEYVEDLTNWTIDQREKAAQTKVREQEVKSSHQAQVEAHQARVKTFAESKADYQEVVDEVGDIQVSLAVEGIILASEIGPEMLYELAKDPKECARICALPPLQAAQALGRLEARIQKAEPEVKKPEVKKTTAPKPIQPVGASAGGSKKSVYDAASLTQAEYEALRASNSRKST